MNVDLTCIGPGTPTGRYLRRFWQPVYRAQDLGPGRAVPLRILGEDLTLYHGESGAPHLVAFRCAHRGTQLSTGWVEGDCIRCLYHGWRYDAGGQCVEQPGEDEGFATKVRIASYPVVEYLGLVFAYLGDGDAPPLRHFPDMEKPGVLETDPPEPWPCSYLNRLDNDPAHVAWTHRESTRRMGTFERQSQSARQRDPHKFVETGFGLAEPGGGGNRYLMPNVNALRIPSKASDWPDLWEHRLIFHVPVDDENSVAFDVTLAVGLTGADAERYQTVRRALVEDDDPAPYEMAQAILAGRMTVRDVPATLTLVKQFWIEDYVTQVGQGRLADRGREHLGRNDAKVILRRHLLEREAQALAEGLPIKAWTSPELYPAKPAGSVPAAASA